MWLPPARQNFNQPQFVGSNQSCRGMSLVEVLVVAAIITLVFGGLIAGVQLMVQIVANAKAEAGALALATEQIEYIRSLDYFAAGTIGGVVSGPVPQTATTSLNGVEYTKTVSIKYIDREQDGLVTDSTPDPIPEDSKQVVVTLSWDDRGVLRSYTMQTDIIPPGLESTDGGGTIVVNVFNKAIQPVSGATIRIYNDTFSPVIDDSSYVTNASGVAIVPGVPAGSNYQVSVSLAGYSSDQTYSASSTNPIPIRPHISVATGTVSTVNFQIDELGDLTVKTIGQPSKGVFFDTFSGSGQVATSTNVDIGGGVVVLSGGPSSYESTGTIFSTTSEPVTLDAWESFDFEATSTADTSVRVRVYEATGVGSTTSYTLIPDGDLPGNSLGFVQGPVNITAIPVGTYDRIALGATLTSSSTNATPELYDWSLTHIESEPTEPNVPFTLTGSKTIGTDLSSNPVYKYQANHTTDGSGSITLTDLEYDGYSFELGTGAFTISEIIGGDPFEKEPGTHDEVTLVLDTTVPYSLRVTVNDIDNDPIGGASVRLQDLSGSYDTTQETSIYGQTYFNNSLASSTYQIDVSATGYDALTVPSLMVDGNVETVLQLVEAGGGTGSGGASSTPSTYLAGYTTRIPLDIDGAALYGTVVDFPVYVDLSNMPSSFFNDVQASGADIRITEDDGLSEVPYELVGIDTAAEIGELHFKAPTLSISTTTRFYMYYGSSTASAYTRSDTYGSENVWTNGYLAVYHLEEEAAGSGNLDVYLDSTSNAAHGDDYVEDTRKDDEYGHLGLGQMFEENTTDYIELPYTVLDGESNVTLSFWYRSDTDNYQSILSGAKDNSSDGANEYLFWFNGSDEAHFFSHGDPRVYFNIASNDDWTWRHYASVRDDNNNQTRLYVNGAPDNENPESDSMGTIDIAPGGLFIGVDQDDVGGAFGQYLDDALDEFRLAGVVRSAAWIANVYLNQNTPTGFYTVGSVQTE